MSDLGVIDPISHDAALEGCIDSCWKEGVVDPQSVISIGVAMIVWGLSIDERDGGMHGQGLRQMAGELIDELAPISLRAAA
mgnify:CR=1 FL=1